LPVAKTGRDRIADSQGANGSGFAGTRKRRLASFSGFVCRNFEEDGDTVLPRGRKLSWRESSRKKPAALIISGR